MEGLTVESRCVLPSERTAAVSACSVDGDIYTFRIARSRRELVDAFSLAYQIYRKLGYAQENARKLWYTKYHIQPYSITFIAVTPEDRVVGAISACPDSAAKLPADALFGEKLEEFRKQGRRLSEVMSFSVDNNAAASVKLPQELSNLALITAYKLFGATDVVITVNPKHKAFYQKRLLFECESEERSYQLVGGAPAVLLRLETDKLHERHRTGQQVAKTQIRKWHSGDNERQLLSNIMTKRLPISTADLRYFHAGLAG